ncbi:LytTR family DNA-binding domain-containing protein [Periweissella fabalis]|uniref:LytTR family transcriptional regulator n=1 Tax=Periweissella fabalis TaxID=1070421 RepID=A0A7X6N090_9LACO|nr:LytTR family DNA-binding domain-containing protein [Periweissella fabalis]MCM0599046.1 LytTR family transcriptional regulator [Periweissella fabalis]NKZ23326.1 LytTR family transcriptional regulator [Periweissella fabalis]
MKITIEIDPSIPDLEVVLRTPQFNEQVSELQNILQAFDANQVPELIAPITYIKDDTEYYFNNAEVLFFETDDRDVYAHTINDAYIVKQRLYELEQRLMPGFMRISKSALLNVHAVYGLTRTVTGATVGFQNSPKVAFVSRRYFKDLKERLEEERNL